MKSAGGAPGNKCKATWRRVIAVSPSASFIRHVRHTGVSLTQQANVGRSARVPRIVGQKANR
jgi:hypothetical protein